MRPYYLDTSALIKRYVAETGSRWPTLAEAALPMPIFLSADDRLLTVALAEGLPADNPGLHP